MSRQDLPEELLHILPLDARSLYFSEVNNVARLPRTEMWELVMRARQGDAEAKQALIESCLPYVAKVAGMLYQTMPRSQNEYLDLVSIGHLALVSRFDHALSKTNPCACLRGIAKHRMLAHCIDSSWLQEHDAAPDIHSLDAPIGNTDRTYQDMLAAHVVPEESCAFSQVLHRGIQEALTPTEREVVIRSYGLYESTAYTNRETASELTGNADAHFAAGLRLGAMEKLRRYLEEHAS